MVHLTPVSSPTRAHLVTSESSSRRASLAVLTRSALAVTGVAILAVATRHELQTLPVARQLPLAAVLVGAVLLAELTAVRARNGEIISVTFGLLVAAQLLLGLGPAIVLGALSVAVDGVLRGRTLVWVVERVALLTVLLAVGELVAGPAAPLMPIVLAWWVALFAAIVWRVRREGDRPTLAATGLTLVFVTLMATHGTWSGPAPIESALAAAHPARIRAAGFMTADTLVAFALIASANAWVALGSWRARVVPVFLRYTLLALAAALVVAWERQVGLPAVVAGVVILLAASLAWQSFRRQHEALVATICALTSALDARDPYSRGHSDRVAAYSVAIADHLGWSRRRRHALEMAAHLHDIGKIGVPDAVLLKPGRFTPEERVIMERHATGSWAIVRNVPDLRAIAATVRQHHERLDGSGYPDGLAAERITPGARILAVADVFDALTSDRWYRAGMTPRAALAELQRGTGTLFDRRAVEALASLAERERLDDAMQNAYCLSH